jgi:hypothetical protein
MIPCGFDPVVHCRVFSLSDTGKHATDTGGTAG